MFDSSAFMQYPHNVAYLKGEKPYPPSIADQGELHFFILFLIVAIGIIGLVIFMTKPLLDEVMLIQNSTTTRGTVIGREIDDSDDGTTYWLSYSFYVDDVMYSDTKAVRRELYDKHPLESMIEITYVVSDPNISRPSEHNPLLYNLTLGVTSLAVILMLMIMMIALYRAYKKRGYIKRNGKLVKGQILSATGETDSDNDFILTLKFTFRTPDTAQTRTENHSFVANHLKESALPTKGTPIYIFYADEKHWDVL